MKRSKKHGKPRRRGRPDATVAQIVQVEKARRADRADKARTAAIAALDEVFGVQYAPVSREQQIGYLNSLEEPCLDCKEAHDQGFCDHSCHDDSE